jgi:hypothetical protein
MRLLRTVQTSSSYWQSDDLHSGAGQRPSDGGCKSVDTLNRQSEEVEISSTTINIALTMSAPPPAKAKPSASSNPGDDPAIRS